MVGKTRLNPSRSRERGSALVLALVVVVAMVAVSASFFQVSSSITRRQLQAIDQKKSFYIAEAGLAESFAGVRIGKTGVVGSAENPALFGNGLFWVEVEDHGNGRRTLESTGMCGTARTVLSVVVEDGGSSVAALGLFSSEDLDIPSGTKIDAYTSAEGPYVPPSSGGGGGTAGFVGGGGTSGGSGGTTELQSYESYTRGSYTMHADIGDPTGARVSSNGDLTVNEDPGRVTKILGDARPGPSGSLVIDGDPEITGSTSPLNASVELPPVQVPVLTQNPGITHGGASPLIIPPGYRSYEHLTVATDAQITVQGPATLVLDDLSVVAGGELVLDTSNGAVHLIVTGSAQLASGSYFTQIGDDPTRMSLQVAGTEAAELHAQGDLFGLLYAPSAELSIGTGLEVFGAIVAQQVSLAGKAKVHFDLTLGSIAEESGLPAFEAWRIVELEANYSLAGDPYTALGVDPNLLRSPGDAHLDQQLDIEYYDKSGTKRTYSGPESSFDWSDVSQVTELERDGNTPGKVKGLAGVGGIGDGSGVVGVDVR